MTLAGVLLIGIIAASQPADLDAVPEKLDAYLEKYEPSAATYTNFRRLQTSARIVPQP